MRSPLKLRLNKNPVDDSSTDVMIKGSISDKATDKKNQENDPSSNVKGPLLLLLVSQFILFIGVGAVIPSIPLYGKALGLTSAANGIVISAPAVALVLGAYKAGPFADAARKPAMLWGMGLICLSDLGTALANGLPLLVVARLGLGAGRCLSESGERGMLADLAAQVPQLRGRALAAQQAVVALGIAIGAPLGGLVVEEYGPRASFLCVSAAAVVALILYSLLPETRTLQPANTTTSNTQNDKTAEIEAALLVPSEAVLAADSSDPHSNNVGVRWTTLLQNQRWRGLALCQVGATFGFAAKIASIPILAAATLPGGAIGAGSLLSAAGLTGLLGAPVGGFLTDRFGSKWTAVASGVASALGLALIPWALSLDSSSLTSATTTGGGGTLPLNLGVDAATFCACVLVWSLGASAQGPALTALAQELAPTGAEATAMALPRAAGDGTYIFAPFLLGLVADQNSQLGSECAVAGLATLLGILALALLNEEESSSRTSSV